MNIIINIYFPSINIGRTTNFGIVRLQRIQTQLIKSLKANCIMGKPEYVLQEYHGFIEKFFPGSLHECLQSSKQFTGFVNKACSIYRDSQEAMVVDSMKAWKTNRPLGWVHISLDSYALKTTLIASLEVLHVVLISPDFYTHIHIILVSYLFSMHCWSNKELRNLVVTDDQGWYSLKCVGRDVELLMNIGNGVFLFVTCLWNVW